MVFVSFPPPFSPLSLRLPPNIFQQCLLRVFFNSRFLKRSCMWLCAFSLSSHPVQAFDLEIDIFIRSLSRYISAINFLLGCRSRYEQQRSWRVNCISFNEEWRMHTQGIVGLRSVSVLQNCNSSPREVGSFLGTESVEWEVTFWKFFFLFSRREFCGQRDIAVCQEPIFGPKFSKSYVKHTQRDEICPSATPVCPLRPLAFHLPLPIARLSQHSRHRRPFHWPIHSLSSLQRLPLFPHFHKTPYSF